MIEKLSTTLIEKLSTKLGDSNYISRSKINEIIDKINLDSEHIDSMSDLLNDTRNRLGRLMEFVEEKTIIKPDYDTDDVKLNNDPFDPKNYREMIEGFCGEILKLNEKIDKFEYRLHDLEIPEPNENLKKAFDDYHNKKPTDEELKIIQKQKLCELFDPETWVLRTDLPKEGSFEWAIIQVKEGHTVRRSSLKCNFFIFSSTKLISFEIDTNDIYALDWEIVK